MSASQEMTLKQWCDKLHSGHKVNRELKQIKETMSLLFSMVLGNEQNSEKARKMYYEAQDMIEGK